uniref:Endonuclease/exonuclease/phosphatase domain-containing protein n=1 Tax=Chromera velia CCMP2878 TaxID=1169474 RepID=A0A0G4GWQ4_9ALVE|eukprot:Cvel_23706.t1-p1 / transcript=Cvel_23706.t1 / gene=Cvel_23706 / organism=Chromera_velia_CCMP2878 / gene_product=hypothetical protein / transcript_product=hypothetical protein / location=Cvel_scaffold2475:3827-5506(-) / protein_length=172 / sequence_SO=supercontig / SO=protein_coding / is_pseudo=false
MAHHYEYWSEKAWAPLEKEKSEERKGPSIASLCRPQGEESDVFSILKGGLKGSEGVELFNGMAKVEDRRRRYTHLSAGDSLLDHVLMTPNLLNAATVRIDNEHDFQSSYLNGNWGKKNWIKKARQATKERNQVRSRFPADPTAYFNPSDHLPVIVSLDLSVIEKRKAAPPTS